MANQLLPNVEGPNAIGNKLSKKDPPYNLLARVIYLLTAPTQSNERTAIT